MLLEWPCDNPGPVVFVFLRGPPGGRCMVPSTSTGVLPPACAAIAASAGVSPATKFDVSTTDRLCGVPWPPEAAITAAICGLEGITIVTAGAVRSFMFMFTGASLTRRALPGALSAAISERPWPMLRCDACPAPGGGGPPGAATNLDGSRSDRCRSVAPPCAAASSSAACAASSSPCVYRHMYQHRNQKLRCKTHLHNPGLEVCGLRNDALCCLALHLRLVLALAGHAQRKHLCRRQRLPDQVRHLGFATDLRTL